MKTILSTLSDKQAQKELKKFTMYAWPGVVIGAFLFSWLGVLGVLFGSRAFLLTFHKGNKDQGHLFLYRLCNGFVALLGVYETLWFWTRV